MGRGFAYQWNPTKLSSESEAFNRTIIENFRQLSGFINGYVPTFETVSQNLVLPSDLTVLGDISFAGSVLHSDGKQHIHVYDNAGSQSLTSSVWNKINLDTENGSHSSDTFTFVAADDKVTLLQPGVYIAVAEVTFQVNESGFLRILGGASTEFARNGFNTTTTSEVFALFYIAAQTDITFEVYPDTAADTTASPSSAATFLEIAKIQGVSV